MKEQHKETWINPNVDIRESPVEGKGMFAIISVPKGQTVVVWGGEFTNAKGAEEARRKGRLIMHLDSDLYSVETRREDRSYFMNHSCDPNVWMSDAFTLEARKDIQKGEELTADYAMWVDEDYTFSWECNCGSSHCRGRITGRDWQIKELQERYKGHFSPLINKRIENLNHES